MLYTIKNEHIRVSIDNLGAELKSIKRMDDKKDLEYLWQRNPEIWERQAPLLFPLIGRLKDGEYIFDEKTYSIPIHGFARFVAFEVNSVNEDEISFKTESNSETLKVYPFEFELEILYKLDGFTITKSHTITNKSDIGMYYEIGGHEGYNIALMAGEKMEDYYIHFPGMKSFKTYTSDEDIMMNKDKKKIKLDNEKLYLSPEVFKNDALIIDEFKQRRVILANEKNNRTVEVQFEDFKYLGLWTKYMRGNYICIEPWSSLPDCNYLGKELENKKDIRKISASNSETLKYKIIIA